MRSRLRYPTFDLAVLLFLATIAFFTAPVLAFREVTPPPSESETLLGTKVLDGRFVHRVGRLQMNVTNWGVLGSFPGSLMPSAEAPSAQWPAGSGVEYLYYAELWVGARRGGIPAVSTSFVNYELLPGRDPRDTIYQTFAGAPHGNRHPSPAADDDGDGRVDEDPLDGRDNDGDGRVDEDFAATSNQMMRCVYRDDYAEALTLSPEHQPLGIEVVQETFQWEGEAIDDFVGVEYTITNVGQESLEEVYVGLYVDPDIHARNLPNGYQDDMVACIDSFICVDKGQTGLLRIIQMVAAYDDDGDPEHDTPAPGWIGVMIMGCKEDPFEVVAPWGPWFQSVHFMHGNGPYGEGGDPVNDQQRYEMLSGGWDRVPEREQDYRFLVSCGPFLLWRGWSTSVRFGFVVGGSREELIANAAQAQTAHDGGWFDLDGDPTTGVDCKETLLKSPTGEKMIWFDPCDPFAEHMWIGSQDSIWFNVDCGWENFNHWFCDNYFFYCTGTGGREGNLNWIYESPPPPPHVRAWATEDHVTLFWDNFSETVPDPSNLDYDFEGYCIWRADNWDRPPGSSESTGPGADLWMLLGEYDVVNGLLPDIGLDRIHYQPTVDANLVSYYGERLLSNPLIESSLDALPPQGYSLADADTAIALARYQLGLPNGRCYYTFSDPYAMHGMPYFYSVTAADHVHYYDELGYVAGYNLANIGSPAANPVYVEPQTASQAAWDYDPNLIYVVPNPATPKTMAPWTLQATDSDPIGDKIEFRHLPAARSTIRVYTLAGDLVRTLVHDGRGEHGGPGPAAGTLAWDLTSRNGQSVASGVYIFSVEAEGFPDFVGRFVLVR